jgi:hypothetical protein
MPSWIDEQIARQRAEDMVREQRLRAAAGWAQLAWLPTPRFYGPLLAGLGRRLVVWGVRLEARYSAIAEPAIISGNGKPISGC